MPKTYITPTYQSNLNSAIRDVIIRLNSGDVFGAWGCLRTLFSLSPSKVEDECREAYQEITKHLKNHCGGHSPDPTMRNARHTSQARRYLYNANLQFLILLKKSLENHGYLEIQPFTPRNPNPEALGVKL